MAILPDNERITVWRDFMRDIPRDEEIGPVTKADLREAVNALDLFLHNNAAAINQAIPQPARTALTTRQKARLLVYVISRRYLSDI